MQDAPVQAGAFVVSVIGISHALHVVAVSCTVRLPHRSGMETMQ